MEKGKRSKRKGKCLAKEVEEEKGKQGKKEWNKLAKGIKSPES